MPTLSTTVDPRSSSFQDNRRAMLVRLDELDELLATARAGGGPARRRIELLLDRDAPFLELGTAADDGAVGGIGTVEGVECMIIASVPDAPYPHRKVQRLGEIAAQNRLPLVHLLDSAGPSRTTPAGTPQSPAIAVVLGPSSGHLPALSDYTIFLRDAGSGLADFEAEDERDAVRLARLCVRRLNWRKAGRAPRGIGEPPKYDREELLGIGPAQPRELLARVLDGSQFDEFKPRYGIGLVTGWGELHGYPVGVLADTRGVRGVEETRKSIQFIQLANASATPLLFVRGTCGPSGRPNDVTEDLRLGAALIQALAGSAVPHLVVDVTAADRGPTGPARFQFGWPGASAGTSAGPGTGQDAVIDPRDTRTVLGLALSAVHSGPVEGAAGYGVVRR